MDEQRGHFVEIVEDQAIPPSNDGTGKRSMRQAVASREECRAIRHSPNPDKIEDVGVVAQVEEEIMPCSLLVDVDT